MPATEQTWRNQTTMHVVFGITSLLMLGGTIWMLAADHRREWKQYQREFRAVQVAASDARLSELRTTEYGQKERELKEAVEATRRQVPREDLVNQFVGTVLARTKADQTAATEGQAENVKQAYAKVVEANQDANDKSKDQLAAARDELLGQMRDIIKRAKDFAVQRTTEVKFERGLLDVDKSNYDIGIRDDEPQSRLDELQRAVDDRAGRVDQLTRVMQAANVYRQELDDLVAQITTDETKALKALEDHTLLKTRLEVTRHEQERGLGERILELPIIDAFGRPLHVDQIWLPKLTLNNNFRDVARFDRCTTCHQGINITAPGSPVDPGYPHAQVVTVQMATPEARPEPATSEGGATSEPTLEDVYGMRLADGELKPGEIRIAAVWPERPAARAAQIGKSLPQEVTLPNPPGTLPEDHATVYNLPAGLRPGDVILQVNDVKIDSATAAKRELLENVTWGQPVSVRVRRGMEHPFSSHPRLDLFLGSTSPHDIQKFGCTICHEGQGSATSFEWASHTPDSEAQREEWSRKYGWAPNHHWIFPMQPKRFAESTCLKCHHEVVDLQPSRRFPEPPAAKLMAGYNIIREYGCFGCHEINGFDGPTRRIGPDLRNEPNFVAAAQQLLTEKGLTDEETRLARNVIGDPENTADRMRLAELLKTQDEPGAEAGDSDEPQEPRLSATAEKLADLIGAEEETPGKFRKVGPSLRHLKSKVDFQFAYDWIRNPKSFRPSTKMPRFFGLYDHFLPEERTNEHGQIVHDPAPGLLESRKFEPVEVRAIAHYLMAKSQPFEYLEQPQEVTEEPSAERGQKLFETRGCLACHQHPAFPSSAATQGPNLARLGDKLRGDDSNRWLYTWLREPTLYHSRTLMPNVFLTPISETKEGKTTVTDPAADIAEFLVSGDNAGAWQPGPEEDLDEKNLDALVLLYLKKAFTEAQALEYVEQGIPREIAPEIKGDEVALVRDADGQPLTVEKKLEYIGRRSISKYGCFGCHDIPGYETAKPIGTGLADWGRKEPDKLAFEQISGFIEHLRHHGHAAAGDHAGDGDESVQLSKDGPQSLAEQSAKLAKFDPDGFFTDALEHHERMGFLWQKLREPRSYDYHKTETKDYNDRLRMPKFNFTPEQIEAVMTFVLGLVAEPPAAQYVHKPDAHGAAIVEGHKVLEKFNCGGCHTLEMASWKFDYNPSEFPEPQTAPDYAFLSPHFTPQEVKASQQIDRRGYGSATVHGMPAVDGEGNLVQDEDENGNPLFYFTLWENKAINGKPWVFGSQVQVSKPNLIEIRPPVGGYLSRWLYPIALADEKATNPNVKESDAWGWVPPPLVGEGRKVQTEWLHNFLLDPYLIRPAVVLRMPRFNMSSQEASKLVDYFAAVDGAEYPYEYKPQTRSSHLELAEAEHPHRLDDAMKIVTNGNYCVKCHHLGDFRPEGSIKAQAPQLDQVYARLRPDYLRDWIANPQRILPYTPMPVNFPPDKPASQELFKGSSEQQVMAVVDLLLNYDTFMKNRNSIRGMVQPATPEQPAQASGESTTPVAGQ